FFSGLFWSAGFLVGALGVATGQLWLLYLGYGVLGGLGLGIGYISPVSTLIKWFPDRPGMATGIAIMGFGGGALIASPLTSALLENLGETPADAIAPTFLVLGAGYFAVMMMGAFTVRVPPEGWTPHGMTAPEPQPEGTPAVDGVTVEAACTTRPPWLVWIVLF